MKFYFAACLLFLGACALPQPDAHGQVQLTLKLPANISAFAPFAPMAVTEPLAACATLRFVRAIASPTNGDPSFSTDVIMLETADLLKMEELSTGEYDITVEIISAAERTVFSGSQKVTIRADETANVQISLIEVGGCPRSNPGAPTVASYPDFSSCSPLTFKGTKPAGTILQDASDGAPYYSITEDTEWVQALHLSDPSLENGFSLETAWPDETNLTSIDKIQVGISFKQCFALILTISRVAIFGSDGQVVQLHWLKPASAGDNAGTIIIAYQDGRSGNVIPEVTSLTTSGVSTATTNATLLAVADASVVTASVTLPDTVHNWELHLFSVNRLPDSSLIARDAGAAWIQTAEPVIAPPARSIWP